MAETNLTLTLVVFEFCSPIEIRYRIYNLTLTLVVFECRTIEVQFIAPLAFNLNIGCI